VSTSCPVWCLDTGATIQQRAVYRQWAGTDTPNAVRPGFHPHSYTSVRLAAVHVCAVSKLKHARAGWGHRSGLRSFVYRDLTFLCAISCKQESSLVPAPSACFSSKRTDGSQLNFVSAHSSPSFLPPFVLNVAITWMPTAAQLAKKFPACTVRHYVHKSPLLDTVLSQFNSVRPCRHTHIRPGLRETSLPKYFMRFRCPAAGQSRVSQQPSIHRAVLRQLVHGGELPKHVSNKLRF
jgi:hypothetical protein